MKKLWRKLFPVKIVHVAEREYNPVAGMVSCNGEVIILTKQGTIYRYYTSLNQGYPIVERVVNVTLDR